MAYNIPTMEPHIQYAKTSDGVSIAFATIGGGTPLVHMPLGFSHIQLEWKHPEPRRWYERMAENRMLVTFDTRGFGLSQREVEASEFALDSFVMDLEAVVERLSLERFALLGGIHTGPPAVAYAVRHPERVSHLVLWCTYTRGAEWSSSVIQATRALVGMDWNTYTETMAHAVLGWSEGEPARRYAELARESCTPEVLQAAFKATDQFDVASLLPQVTTPTLVLHRRAIVVGDSVARGLASRIPDARLLLLDGDAMMPYLGDMEAVASAIDEFLSEGEEAAAGTPAASGMVTILFTDMEGSTSLTQRMGDAKAQEVLRTHNTIVREALKSHGGSEIKHTGDGIMASFASASKALECAIAMQRAFAEQNESVEEPIRVRIGMNAGEPIAEEEDLFGTAVQLAARICGHAEAGQILAPIVVRELAAGKRFLFADRGEVALRGFEDPVRLYEVRWEDTN